MAKPDPALLAPARYPFRHEVTTRFADVDPNHHLNNVAIAALLEDSRVRFGYAANQAKLLEGYRPMVASVAIDYLGEAFFPDPVTGLVGLEAIGRTSWTVVQVLVQHERVFAFARSTIVLTTRGTPTPLPEEFRANLSEMLLRNV